MRTCGSELQSRKFKNSEERRKAGLARERRDDQIGKDFIYYAEVLGLCFLDLRVWGVRST